MPMYTSVKLLLKRAWDNMKACTRKARATERGNLILTGGGPHAPAVSPQLGAIISMVEEAAPVVITEIKNAFDSDGTILHAIDNSQDLDLMLIENNNKQAVDTCDIMDHKLIDSAEHTSFEVQEINEINSPQIEDGQNSTDCTVKKYASVTKTADHMRRPTDYIRREAVMRIKYLENKKKMEIQILNTQLEVEQIKKRSALLEEERNKILLDKAKLELEEVKKSFK